MPIPAAAQCESIDHWRSKNIYMFFTWCCYKWWDHGFEPAGKQLTLGILSVACWETPAQLSSSIWRHIDQLHCLSSGFWKWDTYRDANIGPGWARWLTKRVCEQMPLDSRACVGSGAFWLAATKGRCRDEKSQISMWGAGHTWPERGERCLLAAGLNFRYFSLVDAFPSPLDFPGRMKPKAVLSFPAR